MKKFNPQEYTGTFNATSGCLSMFLWSFYRGHLSQALCCAPCDSGLATWTRGTRRPFTSPIGAKPSFQPMSLWWESDGLSSGRARKARLMVGNLITWSNLNDFWIALNVWSLDKLNDKKMAEIFLANGAHQSPTSMLFEKLKEWPRLVDCYQLSSLVWVQVDCRPPYVCLIYDMR